MKPIDGIGFLRSQHRGFTRQGIWLLFSPRNQAGKLPASSLHKQAHQNSLFKPADVHPEFPYI
jgi:hypothetical protein